MMSTGRSEKFERKMKQKLNKKSLFKNGKDFLGFLTTFFCLLIQLFLNYCKEKLLKKRNNLFGNKDFIMKDYLILMLFIGLLIAVTKCQNDYNEKFNYGKFFFCNLC